MSRQGPTASNRTCWSGIQKKRCKVEGCKKRIKSHFEYGLCRTCLKKAGEKDKHKELEK